MASIPKEKVIQDAICRYLKSQHIYFFRKPQLGGDKKGIPDLVACYKGNFVGIEVKRPKLGIQSETQKVHEKNIKRNGGYYILAVSTDDVKKLFKEIDNVQRM